MLPVSVGNVEADQEIQTGATIIALGYADFIITPYANVFGRRPVTLICCIIVLASTMGVAANSLLGVSLTQSQVFSAPPYNFTPSSVAFANFALVVGAMIGLAIAGPFRIVLQ